jgi:hypothetical protein
MSWRETVTLALISLLLAACVTAAIRFVVHGLF